MADARKVKYKFMVNRTGELDESVVDVMCVLRSDVTSKRIADLRVTQANRAAFDPRCDASQEARTRGTFPRAGIKRVPVAQVVKR